jgi:UDP-N-acetylmuramoyl-tripeptide--D-alanyl-D-alanine ligase
MYSVLNISIAALWFLSAVIDYSGFCYFWQLKWYRWDRFRDFLMTEQGRVFLFRYDYLYRAFIALILFIFPFQTNLFFKQALLVFLGFDLLIRVLKVIKKEIIRPIFSLKALLIIISSLGIEALIVLTYWDLDVLLLAIVVRLLIISLVVITINFLTDRFKFIYFKKARQKIEAQKNLTVIGITGSYGKTTVKELLYQMLESKFKVIKTPKNVNSDIGVSKFILNTDFSGIEIFIVEMGAYNVGDIKLVCDIVHPKIGILTAINEQHLSLFGSIHNTQKTKYELLRALPKDGLAITNSDNALCREFLHELDAEVITFGTEEEFQPNLLVEEISTKKEGVYAKGIVKWKTKDGVERGIQTKLQGEHNIMNLAPCILTAVHFGFKPDDIVSIAERIENPQTSFQIYQYGSATIIDDSYNSNPDGFVAALQVLSKFPSERRRIVISRGMLELGERSNELHEKVGGEIAFVADELIIITPDFGEYLRRGVGTKYNTEVYDKFNPQDLLEYVKKLKNTDTVVLLENRIPELVTQELKSQKN